MKKLLIETYGCQMNVADSEVVASVMQMAGYETTESIDEADAVFLNTCSVRDNAEQKIFHRLEALNAERKRRSTSSVQRSPLIIGVLGCMAERVKADLLEHHHADLVAGPDAYLSLPDLIAQAETGHKAINIELSTTETYRDVVPQRLHGARIGGFVSIMRGCNNFCHYCIVPYTRGRERSRDVESILREVRDLRDRGFKEVTLLGQNVNSYRYENLELRTERCDYSHFSPLTSQLEITLATRRDTVDYINNEALARLDGDSTEFRGTIRGDFPLSSLPAPMELEVKPGAQVIFTKNDKEKRWVNGTIGIVSGIDPGEGIICVVDEEGHEHDVAVETWENVRYTFDEKEQKIREDLLGTFHQYPLRLAWAITVHKSQGLTFRRVRIDFSGGGAFAGGQTYVALSRCTSLEGITLAEPIRRQDIFVRPEVVAFAQRYNDGQLMQRVLSESRADREYREAVEAFDRQDFDAFLRNFFLAIHSRYDIEKPAAQRYIRRKLSIISRQAEHIRQLQEEAQQREQLLKRLAVEYTLLGKECEEEQMTEAAIRNYEKAIELCPDIPDARRRLKRLKKK